MIFVISDSGDHLNCIILSYIFFVFDYIVKFTLFFFWYDKLGEPVEIISHFLENHLNVCTSKYVTLSYQTESLVLAKDFFKLVDD